MKYNREEKIDIGRRTYNGEFSIDDAAKKFGVGSVTIDRCVRLYREENGLPPRKCGRRRNESIPLQPEYKSGYEEFDSMTREELIGEIIKARINEARAKKGYIVKGDGAQKVYEPIVNKNTK